MALTTLQPLAYAVAYVSFFFGVVSTILRFYCRQYVLRIWGWDDYIAVAILVMVIGQQIVLHMFLYWGCGLHIETLSQIQVLNILKWLFVEEVVYYTVHWIIKSAFLFFYLRLSPKKVFRTFVYIGVFLNASIWIINILLACFQCVPFDEILHPGTHPDAICISKIVLLVVPSVLNILEDIYILLLPISTVWSLQMSMRRKIAVLSVIAFGGSSVIIASFRLIPILELYSSADSSWVLGKMIIIASLEIQFAVIAVNLPSLKALWMRYTGGSSSGTGPDKSNSKGYKLSDMDGKVSDSSKSRKRKSRAEGGSITRLERGITNTESEEDLFLQSRNFLQLPMQGKYEDMGAIKVTKNFEVESMKQDKDKDKDHVVGVDFLRH